MHLKVNKQETYHVGHIQNAYKLVTNLVTVGSNYVEHNLIQKFEQSAMCHECSYSLESLKKIKHLGL